MHMEHRGKLKIDSPEEMVFLMFWSSLLSKVPYLFAESLLHCLQRKRSYPTLHKLVHNVCCYMYIFIRLPALQLLLSLSMSVTSALRFLIRSIEHGKVQAHTSMQSRPKYGRPAYSFGSGNCLAQVRSSFGRRKHINLCDLEPHVGCPISRHLQSKAFRRLHQSR
jgi:hypothetical protein